MYISKRSFVRIISFLVAIIVAVGIAAALNMNSSQRYKRSFEQNLTRNVEDLSNEIENIKNTLYKGMYAGTPQMMTQLSSKLWSDASTAKAALAQLPVSEFHLENTYKFLSQVGNFSKSLAEKYSDGEQLTQEDKNSLVTLGEYAAKLSENMWKVEQRINNGELSFEKAATEVQGVGNSDEPAYITEGFTDFEEGYDNYPTLIYDGPFSDHILEKEPVMLKGAEEVSLSDALKKAEKACGRVGLSHSAQDDEDGKMPSYIFTKDGISVAITKNGGYISYMINNRDVPSRSMTGREAVDKAVKYLEMLGISSITDTYYEINGNVCTVNFAAIKDDVILYTDLIKVSVAMDDGDILGFDARGYITNHTDRVLHEPLISADKARATVSGQLTVTDTQLAVVPSSGTNELFCYEFSCTAPDGRQMMIYINADTGKEEQILLLEISENGTLTV